MRKQIGPILFIIFVFAGNGDGATPRRQVSDEQVVVRSELVASGSRVEIYQHGVSVDRSFLKIMERAYEQVEHVTGLKLDTAVLGPMVRVHMSDAVRVSHVWKGYQHPNDPKGIIFLNLRAYHGALGGKNATYAHELTHLFTWRYHSHTLGEGIADYVAVKIIPGAGLGINRSEPALRLLFCQLSLRQVFGRAKRIADVLETLRVRESGGRDKKSLWSGQN